MKLPKDLGGLSVPDIGLQFEVLRTSWIKSYLDSNNKADWKPLVGMTIENITKTPGIGKDIIVYPKRYPKSSTRHFWTTNLRAFKRLNGCIPDNQNQLVYTPQRALNETITTFTDITMLMKNGINRLSQIAKTSDDAKFWVLSQTKSPTLKLWSILFISAYFVIFSFDSASEVTIPKCSKFKLLIHESTDSTDSTLVSTELFR